MCRQLCQIRTDRSFQPGADEREPHVLSNLETALRNAMAKGDASDPVFRQRVYRAAGDALARSMAAKNLDEADRSRQTQQLADAVRAVEASYAPPESAASAPSPVNEAPEPVAEMPEPERMEEPAPDLHAEPRIETLAPSGQRMPPDSDVAAPLGERRDPRDDIVAVKRAPFAVALVGVIAVALAVTGIWWVLTTGAFQSQEARDTSVPNPPLELEEENFAASGEPATATEPAPLSEASSETAASETEPQDWISLFEPADPATLSVVGGASAEVGGDAFGEYALIASPDADAAIGVDVPPGTMEALAGGTAQFSLLARSGDEQPTEISVTCDFAQAGDCGRRRFTVTQDENEFLFRIDLPQAASQGRGRLLITTDIEGRGKSVKLSKVRVRRL